MEDGTLKPAPELDTGIANANCMYRASHHCRGRSDLLSFLQLLYYSDGFRSTDPRDLVYGLLGFPTSDRNSGNEGLFVEPDYSLTQEEAFLRVAEKMAQLYGLIPLLSCVQHGSEIQHTLLPSWIPRWGEIYTTTVATPEEFDNLPRRKIRPKGTNTIAAGGKHISVKGGKVSTVASIFQIPSINHLFRGPSNQHSQKLLNLLGSEKRQAMLRLTVRAGRSYCDKGADWEEKDLRDFIAFLRAQEPEIVAKLQGTNRGEGDINCFQTVAMLYCDGKKLIFDDGDRLALGPEATHTGDWLCVIDDGAVPFVLRPHGYYFYLVGECYLYDYMGGDLERGNSKKRREGLAMQTFEIR